MLCTIPGSSIPDPGWLSLFQPDQLVHLVLYAIWAWVWFKGAGKFTPMAAIGMVTFGATIELFQHYCLTDRSGEWADLVADAAGTACGFWFSRKA